MGEVIKFNHLYLRCNFNSFILKFYSIHEHTTSNRNLVMSELLSSTHLFLLHILDLNNAK